MEMKQIYQIMTSKHMRKYFLKERYSTNCKNLVVVFRIVKFNLLKQTNKFQVSPSDVIILEGILVFHDPRLRELMNMKIFVDTGTK